MPRFDKELIDTTLVPAITRRNTRVGGPTLPASSAFPTPERLTPDAETDGIFAYLRIIRERFLTVALGTMVLGAAALAFSLLQTPMYEAHVTLEYIGQQPAVSGPRDVGPNVANDVIDTNINTDIGMLQNEALVGRVLDTLKVDQRPEFGSSGGATRGLLKKWKNALGLAQAESRREKVLRVVLSNLRVRPQARLIHLWYTAPDPRHAADFANELAEELIRQASLSRQSVTQSAREGLTRRVDELNKQIKLSEAQLQAYAARGELSTNEDRRSVAEDKLRHLEEELSRVQADRIAKESEQVIASTTSPEWLPQVLNNSSLRDYQSKLSELRRQLAELSTILTPSNYKVRRVQEQIAAVQADLDKELASMRKRIQNEYEAAVRREKLLAAQYEDQARLVSGQAARSIHYNTLRRELEANRALQTDLQKTLEEVNIASSVPTHHVHIIGRAVPATRPHTPNIPLNVLIGLFSGVFVGAAFAVIRENKDRSLKTPAEAEVLLQLPAIAAIPSGKARPQVGYIDSLELATQQPDPSAFADSFRQAVASLYFGLQSGDGPRVIVVTSPEPGDGKTTVVCNLGVALAQTNRRVLLINGDLRAPRLHQIFSVPNNHGLSDLLREREPLGDRPLLRFTRELSVPNLFIMPSGPVHEDALAPERNNSTNLLYSERLPDLIRCLRRQFDIILIDAPPALLFPDARLLAYHAEGVILVLRARVTSREAAVSVARRLRSDNIPLLGTILNDWTPESDGAAYYYPHGQRYGRSSEAEQTTAI